MKNRITVTIAGQELNLVVDEDKQYMYKLVSIADTKINAILESSRISLIHATMLACLNITDDLMKANELTENMRAQIKDYIDDAAKAKMEINELKREVARLRKEGRGE